MKAHIGTIPCVVPTVPNIPQSILFGCVLPNAASQAGGLGDVVHGLARTCLGWDDPISTQLDIRML
jgi:hypothetical protein